MDEKQNMIDEVECALTVMGLDENEIIHVKKRNKLLKYTLHEDITEILGYLYKEAKLNKDDVKHLIISNPLILSESVERITILGSIYKKLGFSDKEYKLFLRNYNQALSLNPKELLNKIEELRLKGRKSYEIRKTFIEKAYNIFE